MTSQEASILLHQPVAIPERWQNDWFDPSHQHTLLYNDGYFYTVSYLEDNPTPILFCCQNDLPPKIAYARISLNKEFIAVQVSFTNVVVCDVSTRKRYLLEIKSTYEGSCILPSGVIWSDHGGATQDLILVTNKAIEFYKVSSKKLYCRLVRSINHNAFCFWYNHEHRMIMTASFRQQTTFLSRIQKAQTTKTGNTDKEVLLMDGYFLKCEKANIPMLELPPPDKMPRFELGPGVSNEGIYLLSSYGRLLVLVQYTQDKEDFLTVYHLFKTGHEKIATLSLGGIMTSLTISTYDNLIICHDHFAKKTLVYDLLGPARERTTLSATSILDPIITPTTVAYAVFPQIEEDNIPGAPAKRRVVPQHSNDSTPTKVSIDPSSIPRIKKFDEIEFITPQLPIPQKARDTLLDMQDQNKSKLTVIKLDHPQPEPSFYSTSQFDIHPIDFAYHRVDRIMWKITYNLQAFMDQIVSYKEKLLFLSRRGRCYQIARQQYEDTMPNKAAYGVNKESQLAKQYMLLLIYEMMEKKATSHHVAKMVFDVLNETYVLEYLRTALISNRPHEVELMEYDLDVSQYFIHRPEYFRNMVLPLHERFLTCAIEHSVTLAKPPSSSSTNTTRSNSPVPLSRSISVTSISSSTVTSTSSSMNNPGLLRRTSTASNSTGGGGLFVRKRTQSTNISNTSSATVSIMVSSFMDNSLFMDLDMLQIDDSLERASTLDLNQVQKSSSYGKMESSLQAYLPDLCQIGIKVKHWCSEIQSTSSNHLNAPLDIAANQITKDEPSNHVSSAITSLDALTTSYEELQIHRKQQEEHIQSTVPYVPLTTRRDERGDLIVTQAELLSYVWIPLMLSGKVDYGYSADMLTDYLSLLVDEGIPILPVLCILHLYLLFYQERYTEIRNYLSMRFYTESVDLALTVLQFAGILEEEIKTLSLENSSSSSSIAKYSEEEIQISAQRRIQLQHCITFFQLYGINTLWKLNEKTSAIKWHLTHGFVTQAMDLCRKSIGFQEKGIDVSSISGVEFFISAITYCRTLKDKMIGKDVESVPSAKLAQFYRTVENVFYHVFHFLQQWDPKSYAILPGGSRSRISATTPFPDDILAGNAEKIQDLKQLFGYISS